MLGDPDPDRSLLIIRALLDGGADALELGIPFSDPIADAASEAGTLAGLSYALM